MSQLLDRPVAERARVVVGHGHGIVREALRIVLRSVSGLEVVADAVDGHEAVALALAHRPDVAVLDLHLDSLNGIDAARAIRAGAPRVQAVILSPHADLDYVREAVRAGALGFVVERGGMRELCAAIDAVRRGETYFSRCISGASDLGTILYGAGEGALVATLSPRERQVLQLVVEGHTSRSAAARLLLSPRTVEGYRARIMAKLGCRNPLELVRFAVRNGIVRPDAPAPAGSIPGGAPEATAPV